MIAEQVRVGAVALQDQTAASLPLRYLNISSFLLRGRGVLYIYGNQEAI